VDDDYIENYWPYKAKSIVHIIRSIYTYTNSTYFSYNWIIDSGLEKL
jgi:hypothetical protein